MAELAGIKPHEMTESERLQEEYERDLERIKAGAYLSTRRSKIPAGANKKQIMDILLPEWKKVIEDMSGVDMGNKVRKPKKFIEGLVVVPTPAKFNPSSLGDYAYTKSYSWDGKTLERGPSYSYDTMPNVVGSPYERTVDIPRGMRVWVCTWDGQWGGYWSKVIVYVNGEDFNANPDWLIL